METFRKLTLADKTQVLRICSSIWDGEDYIPNIFEEWISSPQSYFIGLFEDDLLIGFGRLASHGDGNFWLEGLRKDHKLKVKGVGKKIADYLIRIAMEKECKSLKFSTYFNNIESIALNEKIGFSKIKEWSFIEVNLRDVNKDFFSPSNSNLCQVSKKEFITYVQNSEFMREMKGYFCQGWKVYSSSHKHLARLYEEGQIIALKKEKEIKALVATVLDSDKNIFISFINFELQEDLSELLKYVFKSAQDKTAKAVSVIVPNHRYVDDLTPFGFESWEQKDDFLLYEYQGK